MRTLASFTLFAALIMTTQVPAQVNIRFEQYTLDNGLTVILHEDHSAPVTAVVVMYHVGSKNEKPKRTGFAHLFEHIMFKGSQHVADGEHFKLLQEIGANVNGFTTQDGTTYYEVVPSNFVELGLYLESDRMGFLLNALTQEKLDNQRDVVKNERRQNYDNRPYGTASEKIARMLYPETHPYSWPVIGNMEDLSAASADDVRDFFRTYYAPNNASLVLAGDIHPQEVKPWIEKYFGGILRGKSFDRPKQMPATLAADAFMTYEDKVQLPRLYINWHTAPAETPDDASMSVLSGILSSGKNSRLYKTLVYDRQIAQSVSASEDGFEIAGSFEIQVTAKPGKGLSEMRGAVDSILTDVLERGVTQKEIDRVLASVESGVINGMATALGKGTRLAQYYSFTGDPGKINRQMDLYRNVSPADVQRAAKKYLTQRRVMLSIVPSGKTELAVHRAQ